MAFWAVRVSGWLVGESEVRATQVEVAPGIVEQQLSTVYVKRCRLVAGGASHCPLPAACGGGWLAGGPPGLCGGQAGQQQQHQQGIRACGRHQKVHRGS
jgi:hypothetical protein